MISRFDQGLFMSLNRKLNESINRQGISLYLIALGCLLLAPWWATPMQDFALDRSALQASEYWRFWTGQLVHSSWSHLWLNMVGLIVLQQLFGNELRLVTWLWGYAVIALVIGICWLAFDDSGWLPFASFDYVVGLSAMLHGLYAFAACLAMRRDALLASGALLVIGGKVVWELFNGPSGLTSELIGLPVASSTHLYGFLGGLLLGVVMAASKNRPQT